MSGVHATMSTYIDDILQFYVWLEDHPLSVGAVALYGYLLNLRNKERQRLYASGSIADTPWSIMVRNAQIRHALNISKSDTLMRYVKELTDVGLIRYIHGFGADMSTYYFNHYG